MQKNHMQGNRDIQGAQKQKKQWMISRHRVTQLQDCLHQREIKDLLENELLNGKLLALL